MFAHDATSFSGGSPDFVKFYKQIDGTREQTAGGVFDTLILEALGQQGWELIAVDSGKWFFKRSLP